MLQCLGIYGEDIRIGQNKNFEGPHLVFMECGTIQDERKHESLKTARFEKTFALKDHLFKG